MTFKRHRVAAASRAAARPAVRRWRSRTAAFRRRGAAAGPPGDRVGAAAGGLSAETRCRRCWSIVSAVVSFVTELVLSLEPLKRGFHCAGPLRRSSHSWCPHAGCCGAVPAGPGTKAERRKKSPRPRPRPRNRPTSPEADGPRRRLSPSKAKSDDFSDIEEHLEEARHQLSPTPRGNLAWRDPRDYPSVRYHGFRERQNRNGTPTYSSRSTRMEFRVNHSWAT